MLSSCIQTQRGALLLSPRHLWMEGASPFRSFAFTLLLFFGNPCSCGQKGFPLTWASEEPECGQRVASGPGVYLSLPLG